MKSIMFAIKSSPGSLLDLTFIEWSMIRKVMACMSELIDEKNPIRNTHMQSNKVLILSKLMVKN